MHMLETSSHVVFSSHRLSKGSGGVHTRSDTAHPLFGRPRKSDLTKWNVSEPGSTEESLRRQTLASTWCPQISS